MPRVDTVEPLKVEAQHFVDVIKGEAEAISSGHHGLEVVEVLERACKSIRRTACPSSCPRATEPSTWARRRLIRCARVDDDPECRPTGVTWRPTPFAWP